MKVLPILVVAAVFLPALQAFHFDRQPEDDTLDEWLQEQMSDSQSVDEEV